MRCLIIDNYDSFTKNLVHYVEQSFGEKPIVFRNDEKSWNAIIAEESFDSIIVSPGPGCASQSSDMGVSYDALKQNVVPVLGVCLGMQGLAYIYGAKIIHAKEPVHGRTSLVTHHSDCIFQNIPHSFSVGRYHSLMVDSASIPETFEVIAKSECDSIMAIRHKQQLKWGVQFHPESILTPHGMQIIDNFKKIVEKNQVRTGTVLKQKKLEVHLIKKSLYIKSESFDALLSSQACFDRLFADKEHSFWLDSQQPNQNQTRFSFMGAVSSAQILSYKLKNDCADFTEGRAFLSKLESHLEAYELIDTNQLPFDFCGGYVGYFNYEMKALFEGAYQKSSDDYDSVWMHVQKFLAYDHQEQRIWLVSTSEQKNESEPWFDFIKNKLQIPRVNQHKSLIKRDIVDVASAQNETSFAKQIQQCRNFIKEGQSYEICLTNQFSIKSEESAWNLYKSLRKHNPAPFGAYLRHGDAYILSSSPERFLKVNEKGVIQAKPIKGTISRSSDPDEDKKLAAQLASSEKDCAENVMIVDLMRHDLSTVCQAGSVQVTKLNGIESFQTVHQMVSTVEGQLKSGASLMDVLRATFPAGSITGAPKIRTMQILDDLEKSPRGIYCGCIGWLGYNRTLDLNVAIRSASYNKNTLKFGAGGAITWLSKPNDEYQEMILKAQTLSGALCDYLEITNSELKPLKV